VRDDEQQQLDSDIAAVNAALDLAFLGVQLPRDVQTQFRTDFPRANPARDLEAWHRFEQQHPLTFGGMYQFWCAPR
jgi:hypothetical protein